MWQVLLELHVVVLALDCTDYESAMHDPGLDGRLEMMSGMSDTYSSHSAGSVLDGLDRLGAVASENLGGAAAHSHQEVSTLLAVTDSDASSPVSSADAILAAADALIAAAAPEAAASATFSGLHSNGAGTSQLGGEGLSLETSTLTLDSILGEDFGHES